MRRKPSGDVHINNENGEDMSGLVNGREKTLQTEKINYRKKPRKKTEKKRAKNISSGPHCANPPLPSILKTLLCEDIHKEG